MATQQNQEENKKTFPRAVYKRGSGKLVDESAQRYEAESRIVKSQDELTKLGADWVETPAEATTSGANSSHGVVDAQRGVGNTNPDDEKHHHKKGK